MAQLKSTVVQGSLRVTDTTYTTNLNLSGATASRLLKTDDNKNVIAIDMTVGAPSASGNATAFITSVSQGADGKISASKATVPNASTSTTGIVKLTDSYTSNDGSNATTGKALLAALQTLDGNLNSTSPGAGKTLTAFSQTDGKVSATFGNISITPSQAGLEHVTNDKQLPIAGGTMTGRLTAAKGFNNLLTGTGTAGVNNSGTYTPVKWTFNAGVTVADGDRFTVKIPNITNADWGVFMSVNNGTNYYPVGLLPNGRLTTHYAAGCYIDVVFEASGRVDSVYPLAGGTARTNITSGGVWRVINFYDSNSDWGYYQRMIYPNLKAGTGSVHPFSIIMQLANGRWASITSTAPNNPGAGNVSPKATGKAANTNAFRLSPIYVMYANATYADGANIGTYNVYAYHSGLIDARYSFNLENNSTNGFTAYSPVYLVGTISNGLFKLDTTKWWTCTLPSSDDGKVYIHIGDAYDWYRITFQEHKPIYWYKDGAIRLYADTVTSTDTSSALYPIGVTSAATNILKRNTSITMTGGAISAASLSLTGALTVGGASTFNGKLIGSTNNYGTNLPQTPSEGQIFFQISNPVYELPDGGSVNQALVKNSGNPRDVKWAGPYLPLTGGHMTGSIHFDVADVARQTKPADHKYGTFEFRSANGADRMAIVEYARTKDGNNRLHLYVLGDAPSGTNVYGGIVIERTFQNTSNYSAWYTVDTGRFSAQSVAGAIWNDYAEFRKDNIQQKAQQTPGHCVVENGDGTLSLSTSRLQAGAEIITDTYGFSIGEDKENNSTTPLAVSGRVLAYPYESIDEFKNNIGAPVCSGPNGTVSIMTAEEEKTYPSRIIGTISEIPTYERWGSGNVEVNGRVWIRMR